MVGITNAIGSDDNSRLNERRIEITVVGGTTRPESIKNNTIWLNTNVAIPSWQLSFQEPDNPTSGMVWIEVNYETDIKMDLATIPSIIFGIGTSYQYINGNWTVVPAEIYTNNHYYSSNLVLYNGGRYNSNYEWLSDNSYLVYWTGDQVNQKSSIREMTITNTPNYINLSFHNHAGYWGSTSIYYTYIDLTEYDAINITYETTKSSAARTHYFSVSSNHSGKTNTLDNAAASYSWSATTAKSKQTATVDISSLTGSYYFNIGSYSGNDLNNGCIMKIYSVEFVKGAS